ncbi:MAG: endolytic transglycosylase MltG [Oscillospiraceae bacterium]|jgi:UPF0755 protein|nr:endolytic transglycosylase MltG [Oscillospiraceae bacterium]
MDYNNNGFDGGNFPPPPKRKKTGYADNAGNVGNSGNSGNVGNSGKTEKPVRPVPPIKPTHPERPPLPVKPVHPEKPNPPIKPVHPEKPNPPIKPVHLQKADTPRADIKPVKPKLPPHDYADGDITEYPPLPPRKKTTPPSQKKKSPAPYLQPNIPPNTDIEDFFDAPKPTTNNTLATPPTLSKLPNPPKQPKKALPTPPDSEPVKKVISKRKAERLNKPTAKLVKPDKPEKPLQKAPLTSAQKRELRRKKVVYTQNVKSIKHYLWKLIGSLGWVALVVGISIGAAIYTVRAALDFTGISPKEYTTQITIPPHATTKEIAGILKTHGIIDLPGLFTYYSKQFDSDGQYLSGQFIMSSTMSYSRIISTLQTETDDVGVVSITVAEGMDAFDVAAMLEENYICRADDFLKAISKLPGDYEFEKRINDKTADPLKCIILEGCLFPDTYEFYVSNKLKRSPTADTTENAKIVAEKMIQNFNKQMTKVMYKKMYDKGLTLDKFLSLASIVQREASDKENMEKIAGVFFNRMNDPVNFPKLQSDVTYFYGEEIRGYYTRTGVSAAEIEKIISAYDTYECNGLPPGAVCNPGLDAMNAVLNAQKVEFYYFAANTETGEVLYAKTHDQHEKNLQKIKEQMDAA